MCLFSAACPVQRAVSSPTLPSLTNGGRPYASLNAGGTQPGSWIHIPPKLHTTLCLKHVTFSVTVAIISINFSKGLQVTKKSIPTPPTESTGAASSSGAAAEALSRCAPARGPLPTDMGVKEAESPWCSRQEQRNQKQFTKCLETSKSSKTQYRARNTAQIWRFYLAQQLRVHLLKAIM